MNILTVSCLLLATVALQAAPASFYVAVEGNDQWSGRLPAANSARTDGPFHTLDRARLALRRLKQDPRAELTVMVRGGTHFLSQPLVLSPEDSGTPQRPVRYLAFPGEKPVISGGRPIAPWQPAGKGLYRASVPEVKTGQWQLRQLRVGDRLQHEAREPNFDPRDPIRGGWLLADEPLDRSGAFGAAVGNIHNSGDFMEWEVEIPAAGQYRLWLYAAVNMKPLGREGIAGRTGFSVDGGPPVILQGLGETGSWTTYAWSQCAVLSLPAGKHRLRWTNLKGGGLGFDAFFLSDDPGYTPRGTKLAPAAPGKHLVVVQAETFVRAQGRQMTVAKPSSTEYFTFPAGTLQSWPDSPDKEVHLFPAWGWVSSIDRIARIDPAARQVILQRPCQGDIRVGNRFFVANVREALDAPGEFYLDRAAGSLLYLPETPEFQRREVVAPAMKQILFFRGTGATVRTEHIQFRGFTFRDTQYSVPIASLYYPPDGAVVMQDAASNRIQDCTFEFLGGWALVGVGASDHNEFVGNTVHDVGQGGVFLCGFEPGGKLGIGDNPQTGGLKLDGKRTPGDGPSGNLICGNHLHHLGLVYAHVAGFYGHLTHENRICHNSVHDVPRYGLSLKGDCRDNLIAFNEVRRTNLETNDTGAIETYTTTTPNVIHNNLVVDSVGLKVTEEKVWRTPFYAWGIYLDGYSSHQTVTDNICLRTDYGGLMMNGGWNNRVENNIFADGRQYLIYLSNYLKKYHGNKFFRNIIYSDLDPPAPVQVTNWSPTLDFAVDFNLYWTRHARLPKIAAAPWDQWRQWGFDAHSLVADPRFADVAKEDFRLAPGSPAFQLGFRPIDVSRIGPAGYVAPK